MADNSWQINKNSKVTIDHSIAVFARAYTGNKQIFTTYLILTSSLVGGRVSNDQLYRIARYSNKSLRTIKLHLQELVEINFVTTDNKKWFYGRSQKAMKVMIEEWTKERYSNRRTQVPYEALSNVLVWNRFLDAELVGMYVDTYKNKSMYRDLCLQLAAANGSPITKSIEKQARAILRSRKKSNDSSEIGMALTLEYFKSMIFNDNKSNPSIETSSKKLCEANRLGFIVRKSHQSIVEIDGNDLVTHNMYLHFLSNLNDSRSKFRFRKVSYKDGQMYGNILEWQPSTIHKFIRNKKYSRSAVAKYTHSVIKSINSLNYSKCLLSTLSNLLSLDDFIAIYSDKFLKVA